jgi:hypothetical protein
MKVATFIFEVEGDFYEDLIEKSENKIADFIDKPVDQLGKHASYEIDISESSNSKKSYNAKVTARIKNV